MKTRITDADQAEAGAAIGYARVSTTDQDCAAQVYDLRNAGCIEIVTEHASGADRRRPALARLLASIGPGDVLTVVRIDRLARSTMHLLTIIEQLQARGAGLRSLRDPIDTTSPAGLFVTTILGAVAQLERSLIAERTIAGVAAAAREGRMPGNPGLRNRDAAAIAGLAAARSHAADRRALAQLGPHIEVITGARPHTAWSAIARRLELAGVHGWSAERLRRTMRRISERNVASR